MVIANIIEIFLNQMAYLSHERLFDEWTTHCAEFQNLLDHTMVKICLKESKETVYKIFASHGNMEDLVYFAVVMCDYPQIIVDYLQEKITVRL
jgi:hypothetical protein